MADTHVLRRLEERRGGRRLLLLVPVHPRRPRQTVIWVNLAALLSLSGSL